jgi:hypothetical protein
MLRHRERCEGFRYCLERIQELCKLLRLRRLLCQQTTRRWPGGDKALTTILFTVRRVAGVQLFVRRIEENCCAFPIF